MSLTTVSTTVLTVFRTVSTHFNAVCALR